MSSFDIRVFRAASLVCTNQRKDERKVACTCNPCCPFKLTCEVEPIYSIQRINESNADVRVKDEQLVIDFKEETKLDAATAKSLGFKEITVLSQLAKHGRFRGMAGRFQDLILEWRLVAALQNRLPEVLQ